MFHRKECEAQKQDRDDGVSWAYSQERGRAEEQGDSDTIGWDSAERSRQPATACRRDMSCKRRQDCTGRGVDGNGCQNNERRLALRDDRRPGTPAQSNGEDQGKRPIRADPAVSHDFDAAIWRTSAPKTVSDIGKPIFMQSAGDQDRSSNPKDCSNER